VKRLLFATVVALAVAAAWATGMSARFTFESVRSVPADTGLWGIVAFMVAFVTGQFFACPVSSSWPQRLPSTAGTPASWLRCSAR
jgi:hypothetical protein